MTCEQQCRALLPGRVSELVCGMPGESPSVTRGRRPHPRRFLGWLGSPNEDDAEQSSSHPPRAGGRRPGGHVLADNTLWLLAVREGLWRAIPGLWLLLGAMGNPQ